MPDQEMLKRVLELTSRVDERVKVIAENHEKMTERFDKFLYQHSVLAERVLRLETNTWTGEEIEDRVEEVEDEQAKISTRITLVEGTAPYALKIVDQSLEALNKLTDRVNKMEKEQMEKVNKIETDNNNRNQSVKVWTDRIEWIADWCFKIAWIIVAAYILAKLGLGGVGIPAPF